MTISSRKTLIRVAAAALLLLALPLAAGEVATANLDILGVALEVSRDPVTTGVDIPASVQTIFGGKINELAPAAPGFSAVGELTGPGIDTPITLSAQPGWGIALPALHDEGEYLLQNIRLVGPNGEFVQQAVPSIATINVTGVLQTKVKVRQLTPEELRARGITVDARNYEVYEYTFIFGVRGQEVEIPYPVILDTRTHQFVNAKKPSEYGLPPLTVAPPPRFQPPGIYEMDLGEAGGGGDGPQPPDRGGRGRPSIPAALIVPTGFGVLHQFFAVILNVTNAAPVGTSIKLDSVSATIEAPLQMKVAKVMPAVTIGKPVPIYDATTGATFLVAGGQGSAEWTLEALKAGTHSVNIDVKATYQAPNQPDILLKGRVSTAIVVSDPRFQITFSHPDTVRQDEEYTSYSFITNLSGQSQQVVLDTTYLPKCDAVAPAFSTTFICRMDDASNVTLNLEPGEMKTVPYRLKSKISGTVFAAAGTANDEHVTASVQLTMGVSESGIPLSPATLVMPYYSRYLSKDFVDANMQLLGLGYSLATAPLNQYTAKFPRLIKNDVFQRAQDIARAGQRVFISRQNVAVSNPNENREPLMHLALDYLGNSERVDAAGGISELREFDQLRRSEKSGRRAGAAMSREFEANNAGKTAKQFVDDFAVAASHRMPYLLAVVHGAPVAGQTRPYALWARGETSRGEVDVPAEATTGWVRTLAFSELTSFTANGEAGEFAMIGRWNEDVRIAVTPQSPSFSIDLIYPDATDGYQLRAEIAVTSATPGQPVSFTLTRGNRNIVVAGAVGTPSVNAVAQTPLRAVAAAQDLHLNDSGHIVTLLFNRPVNAGDLKTLRDRMDLTITVAKANYSVKRRNKPNGDPTTSDLQIPGATLQEDAKILTINYDKALSTNASYSIGLDQLTDRLVPSMTYATSSIVPRIDNNAPGAILTGKVLLGDNTPVKNAVVRMLSRGTQFDTSLDDGRYMFEFVPRDIDNGIFGDYILETTLPTDPYKGTKLEGVVRLPREVHTVNLVFLGRGSVEGQVRYDDGEVLPNATVVIGSTLFSEFRTGTTDASGNFKVGDLPVGPLTFSVVDPSGRPTFAANAIRVPGEVVHQDLVIVKRQFPGTGTVRVTVRRSDIADPVKSLVANAHVGVYTQGYALTDGYTGVDGTFEFTNVPAGLVSILAAEFGITRESAAEEVDLKPDTLVERTLVLRVRDNSTTYGSIEGVLEKDDPTAPGDESKVTPIPGGIISVKGLPAVTADANGNYVIPDVPTTFSDRGVWVFDPASGRKGQFNLPTLVAGTNRFSPRLRTGQAEGTAKMRVRVFGPRGEPVSGYQVLWPGFPPDYFTEIGNGVYELSGLSVPLEINVVAVPGSNKNYGHQFATGRVRVDFNGQVGVTDLRLPGQGTVITKVFLEQPNCGPPACYSLTYATASITYPVWNDEEQDFDTETDTVTADPATNVITFTKVPALVDTHIATVDHPAGYASASTKLLLEGDVRNINMFLTSVGDVSGRVYLVDRRTPAAGASVRFMTGSYTYQTVQAAADGSFRFPAIARGVGFRIQAEMFQDGIYRTGFADGSTPSGGGPVSNVIVLMREQSTVEGKIVDTSGAVVPLARYWLRELAWPGRPFGSPQEPLIADKDGKFLVANVFTGPFRITAVSPDVQEFRGDYVGDLEFEGDARQRNVSVVIAGGTASSGSISVSVVDPSKALEPVENAEVRLYRDGRAFDAQTTNASGVAVFDFIPTAGSYFVTAYSKGRGRGGSSGTFGVGANQTTSVQVLLSFLGNCDGYVTDPESEPAANARVPGIPVTLNSGQVATRASTDANGVFLFQGVPEGVFTLAAYDLDSGRMGFSTQRLEVSRLIPEVKDIHLELERYADLNVKAYLPNDAGGPGQLAPLVDVLVKQTDYVREAQGNNLTFKKMLPRYGYDVLVKELGGENREVRVQGGFGGALHADVAVTFSTSGSVEVTVLDGLNQPVQDARVSINGRILFTPANGVVSLSGMPFGWVSVTATKGNVSASRGGSLASRSVPLKFTLNLGNNASATGYVEAEGAAAPSVGTRVLMTVTSSLINGGSTRLETLTDATGHYVFTGIPIGNTRLSLLFYGPDDTTVGDTDVIDVPNGTTGTITIPPAKLDATPPRVTDIQPPTNSTNVSPSTDIVVTFSEAVAASFLDPSQLNNWFQLVATDTGIRVNMTATPSLRPDGTYVVTLTPPPPPAGQKFPLKSNTLYRFAIPAGVQDTTGNAMKIAVGSSFTTVNYTEPAVVRVEPADDQPVALGTTFRVKFNKAIDVHSFDAGNGGIAKLEKLDAYKGAPIGGPLPISYYMDLVDPTTLVVAPQGWAIEEASFYRLTVANAKDTQTPANVQKDAKVVDYFSFDTTAPVATIISPVAAGEKLVSGATYTATVKATEPNSTIESKDVKLVDWFDGTGTHKKRVLTKPYEYVFVAPSVNAETSYTLQASATDLSNNESARATFTWTIIPNSPPQNLAATHTPASVYPSRKTQTRITFTDEDLEVTVNARLRYTHLDGTTSDLVVGSRKLTRASITTPFDPVVFDYTIPDDAAAGTAHVIVTATDINQKASTIDVPLEILADTTVPEIVSITPKTETHFTFNQTYTIEVKVRDNETKVTKLVLLYDPKKPAEQITNPTFDAATGISTFRKSVTVPPKNADTRVHTVATVTDLRNNIFEGSTDIIWDRVDDNTIPTAEWITPLDGGAFPKAQTTWNATLRVRATDNVKVTSVTFVSSAIPNGSVSVTTPKSGTTDIFESKVALTVPDDPFVITAQVADGDESHLVELPITIDPVALTAAPITANFSISTVNVADYTGKSVFVRGAKVNITTPLQLKDLILVDGATISTLEETKVDLTITDHLFVDADSRIDVSGKGYLGGLRTREGGGLSNSSQTGRTYPGTTTGGTSPASDASYGGNGGTSDEQTNAIYGSITEPVDFGSGGGGVPGRGGTNGGGALLLRGASGGLQRFVVAGAIRADGEQADYGYLWTCGSGGTINLRARTLITSKWTRITANGADEGPSTTDAAGGGGGRIAIRVTDRYDVNATLPIVQARGGRNAYFYPAEGTDYVDGGAGTIYLVRPGATQGELIVSAYDERFPSTQHRVAGTPLAGTLAFDAITVGPRTLARFDDPYTIPTPNDLKVDPSALVLNPTDVPQINVTNTTPAANAQIAQSTSVTATYTAQGLAGIARVNTILSVQPADVVTKFNARPTFVSTTNTTITVPSNAAPGETTLKLRVVDRAGRMTTSAPITFNVVTNAAPSITQFDVTPASMFANHTITVAGAATDDIAVTSLALTSSTGTVTSQTPVTSGTSMTRGFTVAVPPTAVPGTPVTLTLAALDAFPNRVPTTQVKTVDILHDTVAPSVTFNKPTPSQEFLESSTGTFDIEVVATDAEVGVQSVKATFEGQQYTLTAVAGKANTYAVTGVKTPAVDGTDPVAKTVTVNVNDYEPNTASQSQTIFIRPLIDPNAPKTRWACSSPNALYPAGYSATLRVYAEGVSQSNGVQKVEVTINGGAPIAMPETPAGSHLYETTFAIPAGTAAGTVYNVRVSALSTSGAEASLLATMTVVSGLEITSISNIAASDTAFENSTLIVKSGGTLNVTGPHTFKDLVILNGGKLVQKHIDVAKSDLINTGRLYIGCGATIDVSSLGYTRFETYPGAASPDDSSGGGHIGQGGIWGWNSGTSYGSVFRPQEAGGGAAIGDANYAGGIGGGSVHINATTSATIDGTIRANGYENGTWGSAAGGSVWISTNALSGAGSIEARGSGDTNNRSGGGGGAIALEYQALSGTLTSNLSARGGYSTAGRPGSPGSIYLKGPSSTYGDLIVDNKGTLSGISTSLPSLGALNAISVASKTATTDSLFIPSYFAGHSVRVIAPDGTERGTWRIASVQNHASVRSFSGFYDVFTQDAVAYDGYIMYCPSGYPVAGATRTFLAVRYNAGAWQYDNDSTFVNFSPSPNDFIAASFSKDTSAITNVATYSCASGCAPINGVPVLEHVSGLLMSNYRGVVPQRSPMIDNAEIYLTPAFGDKGIVFSAGRAAITLEDGATPVDVRAGDVLRGIYRFDNVTLATTRLTSVRDLFVSTAAPVLDAQSTLASANAAAPKIDLTKISYSRGLIGAVLVGAPGAVSDTETVDLVARNTARVQPRKPASQNVNWIDSPQTGGGSVRKIDNGLGWGNSGLSSVESITGSGYLQFRVTTVARESITGFTVNDTTINYNEPGLNGFHLNRGTYEVWVNGSYSSAVTGPYTTATLFRLEKTPSAIRWYIDGKKVYELTTGVPAKVRLDVAFNDDGNNELNSLLYDTSSILPASTSTIVAADGSFTLPVDGAAGDVIALTAWDRHAYPLPSREVTAGPIPNDVGVSSVTFASPEVTGGRTIAGTVTLLAPAGAQGALVTLASSDSKATVPATVTVPANTASVNFNITTVPVTAEVNVTISATYAASTASGVLKIVKDNIAPTVTITAPAPNTQFSEGSATKIPLQATVIEEDSGLASVIATINGQNTPLAKDATKGPNVWTAQVPSPFIDGNQPVTLNLTVNALDNNANPGSATVPVIINPILDQNPPTIAWSCSPDQMFAAGAPAILRVTATAPNANNPLQRVEFQIEGQPTLTATNTSGTTWEATWNVPNADANYNVTALAVVAGGASAQAAGHLTGVIVNQTFSANATISDATYDNKSIAVTGGTLTISGTHTFKNLLILGGVVTHPAGSPVQITANSNVYLACGAQINVAGRGYGDTQTYPGQPAPFAYVGGTHIGRGRWMSAGATFGSVYRPLEMGGGAYAGFQGGGAVRIIATQVVVNGGFYANGADPGCCNRSGAGGSIWITTQTIRGVGTVEARGGFAYYESGGGGAIAIEYTDPTSTIPAFGVRSGPSNNNLIGGAGTFYVKGPSSTYGDVTIDNGFNNSTDATELPALGGGVAQTGSTGATLVTDRTANIQPYFAGHWVEISNASGTLKGTWRVSTINAKTVTLAPNASETIDVQPGDKWQGVYRFDNITVTNGGDLWSNDPVRVGNAATISATGSGDYAYVMTPLDAPVMTLKGNVCARTLGNPSTDMTVESGANVVHLNGESLKLTVGKINIKGNINVTSRGYGDTQTYPGAPAPFAYVGGTHIGHGRWMSDGASFGSVYRPQELGGGAYAGYQGGGAVRIIATNEVVLDGGIYANGTDPGCCNRAGAGGSVWITTGKISGTGRVEVRGGNAYYESGGGGAIAIEYTDPASVLPATLLRGGTSNNNYIGGSGTLYVKGATSTYGDLTIDNSAFPSADTTELPALGGGTAQTGSTGATLVTDRSANIPAYFAGHWVEIRNATGTLKGTWRVSTINTKTVTLAPNAGETIDVQPGDKWQGVYRFDNVTVNSAGRLLSSDPIRITNGATVNGAGGDYVYLFSTLDAPAMTVKGNVAVRTLNATNLTVDTGAYMTHINGESMTINTTNLTVKGSIDASGRGYGDTQTYPGAPAPHAWTGGTHIGHGRSMDDGSTFGSVYRPRELGGGAYQGYPGGGAIRINATGNVVVDGTILANGTDPGCCNRAGAGGSIWITSGKISGAGSIQARGGNAYYESGGGGAIAIEYTDPASVVPSTLTRGGTSNNTLIGGAGSVYIKGATSTYGDLIIDQSAMPSADTTELPAFGSGFALTGSSGATLVTDRTVNIPAYFVGHWVEISTPSGTLKGTWRIGAVNLKTATLTPNAGETIDVQPGDKWQGVYRFDNVRVSAAGRLLSNDPLRITQGASVTVGSGDLVYLFSPLDAPNMTISGRLAARKLTSTNMTVESGSYLTHINGESLTIDTGKLTIKSGGAIDVSGRGYPDSVSYPGGPQPYAYVGGTHIGRGKWMSGGATFGSIYRPQELGGAAYAGYPGGGALRVTATSEVVIDGAIYANGSDPGCCNRAGAGGSVWITTGKISGTGRIEARGGAAYYESGGGGAIAVEYTDPASVIPTTLFRGGTSNNSYIGGPGALYTRGPSATYGDLTIDNAGLNGDVTELPSLGSGGALAGSSGATLVTDRSANIPPYFVGHWVQIRDNGGVLKGTWRISAVSVKTITLAPNGVETINVQPGDQWQGIYRFDVVKLRTANVVSADAVSYATLDSVSSSISVNDGPPQFPTAKRSQIVVENNAVTGDFVTGPAGAVTDLNTPLTMTATNVRTSATFTAAAAADGSFRVPVQGIPGDTFTIKATDSHSASLTSQVLPVNGQIVEVNTIATLTVQPATVTGGAQAIGVVRLTNPARALGAVVTLTSSDPSATVPATLNIAGGISSAQFTVNTTSPASQTNAVITGTLANSVPATLTVTPAGGGLANLVVAPNAIEGGATVNGTITLAAAAPASGATVSLYSSDTSLATVPQTITIPSGTTDWTFSIATSKVGAASTATITAIYGNAKSAPLSLSQCASLGSVAQPSSATLTNTWIDDALPANATSTGDGAFTSAQSATGTQSVTLAGTSPRTWTVSNMSFPVAGSDNLVLYALINPCNPPREILLTWSDATTDYRASFGEDLVDATIGHLRVAEMPARGTWVRLEVLASRLWGNASKTITKLTVKTNGGELWLDRIGTAGCSLASNAPAPTDFAPADIVAVDDAVPAGVTTRNDTNNSPNWVWDITQRASGSASHVENVAGGFHQHYYYNDPNPVTVAPGDVLYTYVLLDPCNPPREVMLQWNDGSGWEHRAYWGEDLTGSTRTRVGPLPELGKWVRLEVPASQVGLNERKIYGVAFSLVDGRAWFDRYGKLPRVNLAYQKPARQLTDYTANDPASRAVDGNVTSAHGSMSVTTNQSEQWWEVDLGTIAPIESLEIRGRTDCCSNQTQMITAFISDTPITAPNLSAARSLSGVGIYRSPGVVGSVYTMEVHRSGRYVRLWREGSDHLTLPEVFVWAPAHSAKLNLAAGRPTYSPPGVMYLQYYPEHAVNGSQFDTYNTIGGIFHTVGSTDNYWQVDLGSVQPISMIDVSARTDGYPEQLTGFYVFASDQPFASELVAPTLADPNVSVWYVGSYSLMTKIMANRTARYVRLQRAGSGTALVFTEVRVWSQQANTKLLSITAPAATQ